MEIGGKRAAPAEKGLILFISNEDLNGIIKIIKSSRFAGINW